MVIHRAGQTEVGDFGLAVGRDQQVCRFDVAMNQALTMCMREAGRGLRNDGGGFAHSQRSAIVNVTAQIGAGDIFANQEVDVAIVASVERADQVLVVERRHGADFAREVGDRFGRGLGLGKHLDGDFAGHQRVLGLENLAHPPLP